MYFGSYDITGNGITRKAGKSVVISSSYRPHRRSSYQRNEPFRPRPLGSRYRGGQAGKGMPRHVGGQEEPVLAWRKSHEQDCCCSQQGDVRGALGAAASFGHARSRKVILETCSAQQGTEACNVLLICSAPSMGARDQREYQWASAGILPEGQGPHGYTRGVHPKEVP